MSKYRQFPGVAALGMLLVSWPLAGRLAAAPACAPVALLEGDPVLVALVRDSLARRGVAGAATDGCPVVHAELAHIDSGLRVVVDDPYGRRSQREVGDVESAATLIDSWTRADVSDPLLAAHPVADSRPPLFADDEVPAALRAVGVRVAPARQVGVAIGATSSLGTDGSLWVGFDLSGCLRYRHACVGPIARWHQDSATTGASADEETHREGLDLLFATDLPLAWGPVTVSPGVALGVGWIHSDNGGARGHDGDVDGGGPRASAHVRVSTPLRGGLSLDLGLSADLSMHVHHEPYQVGDVTLAGEPHGYVRATLGLRYGVP